MPDQPPLVQHARTKDLDWFVICDPGLDHIARPFINRKAAEGWRDHPPAHGMACQGPHLLASRDRTTTTVTIIDISDWTYHHV